MSCGPSSHSLTSILIQDLSLCVEWPNNCIYFLIFLLQWPILRQIHQELWTESSRTKWTGLAYGWELRPCQFPSSTDFNRAFNSPEGFILSHPTFNIIILGYIFIVSENTCGLFLLTGALHHRCLTPHLPLCISVVNWPWLHARCPPKQLCQLESSFLSWIGKRKYKEIMMVKIRTGRDHSPLTVTGKADSAQGNQSNLSTIKPG